MHTVTTLSESSYFAISKDMINKKNPVPELITWNTTYEVDNTT